ncbi:MAG: efflux RND transporter periplasmic adaptor subunit [Planctomycetes bacterium]|nr:efflux RND transporter periplasmic adaptor subunit [Planctomycetota bacterium]
MALSKQGKWIARGLALIVVAALCLPVVHRIEGNVTLKPAGDVTVYITSGGYVEEVFVQAGERVAQNQILARLSNEALENSAKALELEIKNTRIRLNSLGDRAAPAVLASAQDRLREMQAQFEKLEEDLAALTIRAPIAGVIATDYLDQRIGEYVGTGARLCQILNPDLMLAEIEIEEREVRHIVAYNAKAGTEGSPASITLKALPNADFASRVYRVYAPRPEENEGLSSDMAKKFRVQIYLDNSDAKDSL